MDAEAAVDGGAVEAEEDAVGDGGPGGVLGAAVEAHLVLGLGLEAAEDGVLVGEGVERHGCCLSCQAGSPAQQQS